MKATREYPQLPAPGLCQRHIPGYMKQINPLPTAHRRHVPLLNVSLERILYAPDLSPTNPGSGTLKKSACDIIAVNLER